MVQLSKCSKKMDARDHFINGDSLKIHKSRGNFFRIACFALFAFVFIISGCDKEEGKDPPKISVVYPLTEISIPNIVTVELEENQARGFFFQINVQADAGIKTIEATNGGVHFVNSPQTSGFDTPTENKSVDMVLRSSPQDVSVVVKVTDNKNRSAEKQFTISFVKK